MEVVHPVCAGMDVHKADVKVCLVWRDAEGARQQEIRTYATTTGTFVVPPPKAEEMYAPETFGRGSTDRVTVE